MQGRILAACLCQKYKKCGRFICSSLLLQRCNLYCPQPTKVHRFWAFWAGGIHCQILCKILLVEGEEHAYNCLGVPTSYLLPLIQTLTLASPLTHRVSRHRYAAKWNGLTLYKILTQKCKRRSLASVIPSVKCIFMPGSMIPAVELTLLPMFQKNEQPDGSGSLVRDRRHDFFKSTEAEKLFLPH